MTTITIERAFLIKVLNQIDIAQSLLERSQHHAKMAAVYEELRAALAASATAPAQPAPERKPMPILEFNARWEQSVLDITRLQYYQVVREVEAFHGITGGKP